MWCDAIRSDPAAFKRTLKKACQDPSIASREAWGKTKLLQSITQTWQCGDCDKVLKSKQALAAHRVRKHGARHIAHWLVAGTSCPVCMTEFWTRHKYIERLQDKAPRCLAYLTLFGDRLTDAQVATLDEFAVLHAQSTKLKTSRRAAALRPAERLPGPLPAIPSEEPPPRGAHHPLGVGRRWLS